MFDLSVKTKKHMEYILIGLCFMKDKWENEDFESLNYNMIADVIQTFKTGVDENKLKIANLIFVFFFVIFFFNEFYRYLILLKIYTYKQNRELWNNACVGWVQKVNHAILCVFSFKNKKKKTQNNNNKSIPDFTHFQK